MVDKSMNKNDFVCQIFDAGGANASDQHFKRFSIWFHTVYNSVPEQSLAYQALNFFVSPFPSTTSSVLQLSRFKSNQI